MTTQETGTPPRPTTSTRPGSAPRRSPVSASSTTSSGGDSSLTRTSLDALRAAAAEGPITLYCGFDPTAPSLHMGNLAADPHRPPLPARRAPAARPRRGRNRDDRRPRRSPASARSTPRTSSRRGSRASAPSSSGSSTSMRPDNPARMVNNYDWTQALSTLEFLRDVGKHFSVNRMLDREAVAARLAGNGISYTEFSYQLLQSYDYLRAAPGARLHAADRRLRPVGQHRRGRRPDPPRDRAPRARAHDAAGHQGRRHEVRQDRVRHRVARPGAHLSVRLLPVLAQRRGRDHRHAAADVLVPAARRDRGAGGRRCASGRRRARPSVRWPRSSPTSSTAPRSGPRSRRRRRRSSARATSPGSTPPRSTRP